MEIIKQIWRGKGVPEKSRKALISPIYKKGNKTDVKSYRGISLLDTTYKVYAAILSDKLRQEVEEKCLLPDSQAGFRKSRSTIDNIYALNYLIEKVISKTGGSLYAFFIDFSAAFDTINRPMLWRAMQKMSITEAIRSRIENIYADTTCIVKI